MFVASLPVWQRQLSWGGRGSCPAIQWSVKDVCLTSAGTTRQGQEERTREVTEGVLWQYLFNYSPILLMQSVLVIIVIR